MSTVLKVVGASWMQTKISSYILGILGILAILALFIGQMERIQEDGNYAATVFYSNKTGYRIEFWGQSNDLETIPSGVARAYFRADANTTGWSLLEVETNSSYPDEVQAYAAGVVEGALTWMHIHKHLENTVRDKCEDTPTEKQCNKLKDTLDKSVDIWKNYASEHQDEDPFWHQVFLYYKQIHGIFTGWRHGIERSMKEYETDISELFWLNSLTEIAELQHKLNITIEDSVLNQFPDLSTAMLRVVNETGDKPTQKLFIAKNAFGSYNSMTRILKKYKLNYHYTSKSNELIPGSSVEFAGFPGTITSQDEFYLVRGIERKLAITGTALRNYNPKLWKEVNITEQVPVGPRIVAANHLANNISSWAHILASSNSGTASKQWLIVDITRFENLHQHHRQEEKHVRREIFTHSTISKKVKHTVVHRATTGRVKGLVMLVEQVPALTHSADLSDAFLEKGYWASYGLPFFKDVAEITHLSKILELYGDIFSETESPRAILFKLGYKNATSLESIIKLMRQNNMTAMSRASNETIVCETEAECVARDRGYWAELGVRGDIAMVHKMPCGVIDTKIVKVILNSSPVEFIAVAGPPHTEITEINTTQLINKGNIAPIYIEQFDDKPDVGEFEIRDLFRHQKEEEQQEALDILNRDAVKPFQWSNSDFETVPHLGLPDKWDFGPYETKWSW